MGNLCCKICSSPKVIKEVGEAIDEIEDVVIEVLNVIKEEAGEVKK